MAIIITMLLLGMLLGFIGAGGAGFIIAILTLMFHIPIHTALGTSLTAMAFTCFSGVISHYREGNITIYREEHKRRCSFRKILNADSNLESAFLNNPLTAWKKYT